MVKFIEAVAKASEKICMAATKAMYLDESSYIAFSKNKALLLRCRRLLFYFD